jgi:hypothetical protein
MVRQKATPSGIGEDHQFGHDSIERCVTTALNHSDPLGAIGFAIDVERKIDAITRFGLPPQLITFGSQGQRQAPECP